MKAKHLLALTALSMSAPAMAHTTGIMESSLIAGVLHPLTGIDHLLAMTAVGLWLATQSREVKLPTLTAFMGALGLGFLVTAAGFTMPLIETGIAASVLVLGLLLTAAVKLPKAASISLMSGFALFHGAAHGAELTGSAWVFALGFLGASAAVTLASVASSHAASRVFPMVTQLIGVLIAMAGLSFIAA